MIRKALVSLAALAALIPTAHADSGWGLLNMTQGVTAISREIYKLHMLIFYVCVIIGVIVFGVMIYSLVKFRKSQGSVADTTMVHNTKVEIVWTVIPVAILFVESRVDAITFALSSIDLAISILFLVAWRITRPA